MLGVFLDLETTGLDSMNHVPLEIAFKIVDIKTAHELHSYHSIIHQPMHLWEKRDPKSVKINGFCYEEVQKGKFLKEVEQEVVHLFEKFEIKREKAVFICQNPSFDRSFFCQIVHTYKQQELYWPYHWLDFASMYWALLAKESHSKQKPFPKTLNLSKNAIAERYSLEQEQIPHRAMNGVNHLLLCYQKVVGITKTST